MSKNTVENFEDKIKKLIEELDYDFYKELFVYEIELGENFIKRAREIFEVEDDGI